MAKEYQAHLDFEWIVIAAASAANVKVPVVATVSFYSYSASLFCFAAALGRLPLAALDARTPA
jgi:hypothetical protein